MSSIGKGVKKQNIVDVGVCILFMCLFLFGEKRASEDWYSYYALSVIREPGYALLVRGCYELFGEWWVHAIALIQNSVAVFSLLFFRRNLSTYLWPVLYRKSSRQTAMLVMGLPREGLTGLVATVCLLIPHIMTPLGSNTHLILTNTVMAEGISLSLFYCFMVPLIRMCFSIENRWKLSVQAFLWALLMCQFRGQMMVAIILTAIVTGIGFGLLKEWRKLIFTFGMMVICFAANSVIGGTYQYLVNGMYTGKTLGPANMLCNVLYVAERDDGNAIEDTDLRKLFYTMYDGMKENQLLDDYAEAGIINRERYYQECHDTINYDHFEVNVQPYLQEHGVDIGNYTLYRVKADETAAVMMKALLPRCWRAWLENYIAVIAVGFIRTVAVVHPILNIYAIAVYMLAVVLIIRSYTSGARLQAGFMAAVLVSIIGMVCATGLMIECWPRYVFYNMPFFYLAGWLMVEDICPLQYTKEEHE